MVRDFEDRLGKDRSPAMVRKVMISLSSIVTDAQERGLVAQNVVRELQQGRRTPGGTFRQASARQTQNRDRHPDARRDQRDYRPAVWKCAAAAADRDLYRTARGELRGLRWADIDLKRAILYVRQRADRYQQIGRPKSAASERTVPLPPLLVNTLREWKLTCPPSALGLAFVSRTGQPHRLDFHPAQIAAGVTDAEGRAKYGGLHTLRHFCASWCINRRADGGLELPLKVVQTRLGHADSRLLRVVPERRVGSRREGLDALKTPRGPGRHAQSKKRGAVCASVAVSPGACAEDF
jgi:integrase